MFANSLLDHIHYIFIFFETANYIEKHFSRHKACRKEKSHYKKGGNSKTEPLPQTPKQKQNSSTNKSLEQEATK
jgi:hypothetical protein